MLATTTSNSPSTRANGIVDAATSWATPLRAALSRVASTERVDVDGDHCRSPRDRRRDGEHPAAASDVEYSPAVGTLEQRGEGELRRLVSAAAE